jgi:hypothetical protein
VERCAQSGRADALRFSPRHVLERVERLGDPYAWPDGTVP